MLRGAAGLQFYVGRDSYAIPPKDALLSSGLLVPWFLLISRTRAVAPSSELVHEEAALAE
jgi:hypothetical protein